MNLPPEEAERARENAINSTAPLETVHVGGKDGEWFAALTRPAAALPQVICINEREWLDLRDDLDNFFNTDFFDADNLADWKRDELIESGWISPIDAANVLEALDTAESRSMLRDVLKALRALDTARNILRLPEQRKQPPPEEKP